MSEEVEEITPDDIEQAQVTAWLSDKGVTDEPEETSAETEEPLESAEIEGTVFLSKKYSGLFESSY